MWRDRAKTFGYRAARGIVDQIAAIEDQQIGGQDLPPHGLADEDIPEQPIHRIGGDQHDDGIEREIGLGARVVGDALRLGNARGFDQDRVGSRLAGEGAIEGAEHVAADRVVDHQPFEAPGDRRPDAHFAGDSQQLPRPNSQRRRLDPQRRRLEHAGRGPAVDRPGGQPQAKTGRPRRISLADGRFFLVPSRTGQVGLQLHAVLGELVVSPARRQD